MSDPIPHYLFDRDYFPRNDPRREQQRHRIEQHERIDNRIAAGVADGSYSVVMTAKEMAR